MFRLHAFSRSDVGKRREHNEDAYQTDTVLGLFVVADGVGGASSGETASREACEQIHNYVSQNRGVVAEYVANPNDDTLESMRRLLESAVQSACYMIFGMASMSPDKKGMATTISALLIGGQRAVVAQVGDSRVYQLRGGFGTQLTQDHTLFNWRMKKGLIDPIEARNTKAGKNVITRAVGRSDYEQVDTDIHEVRRGDLFLLCSDGLHGYLDEGDLEGVLHAGTLQNAPKRFIDVANQRGGKDNITAVLVVVE